jgi:Undecaprenyl-phosphate glucose phosphotransferase
MTLQSPPEGESVTGARTWGSSFRRIFHPAFRGQDASRPLASSALVRQTALLDRPSQAIVQEDALLEAGLTHAGAAAGMTRTFNARGLITRLYPLLTEMWQCLDVAVVAGALYVLVRTYDIEFSKRYLVLAVVTAVLMLFVYSWSDLFYRLRTRTLTQEAGRLLRAWAKVLGLLLVVGYLIDTVREFPRLPLLIWAAVAYFAQLLVHILIRKSMHGLRRRGYNIRSALVIGCGAPLKRYASFIGQNPWLGIRVEGYVAEPSWLAETSGAQRQPFGSTLDCASVGKRVNLPTRHAPSHIDAAGIADEGLRHLGGLDNVSRLIDELSISEIYVTLPLERSADAEAALRTLVNIPVNVNWIPDFSLAHLFSTRADKLGDHPLILLSDSRIDRHGRLVKRFEDVVLSVMLLVLFAPLMIAIACAVKVSSPGPVLFKQRRHGLNGRPIVVWKFRTMRVDPTVEITKQATPDDTRITPVGGVLRRWSLDELPQLFNVLQGRMSLVGPRPHPLWLNDRFSKIVDAYMQRHRVKPGLTGWAQVHGYRGETDTWEKMEQRVRYDLHYITHWSPGLDLKIIAHTLPVVLLGKNAY